MTNNLNNPYVVLARKYRPQDFTGLVGQNVLVRTLSNAISMQRIPHAFLLTGIRGVGKTTSARIISKTLNCTAVKFTNNIAVPCGECQNCHVFNNKNHPDIIEIDAASKTGVADIREIIVNCNYMPQIARYKIYVIDEVHMLSTSAFNALLKTLEEPPAHVILIFATTEIRKVPLTILSRCHRFDLRRLSVEEIVEHLKFIIKQESFIADENALTKIARCSGGSIRDGLSILDQLLLVASNKHLKYATVEQNLGVTDKGTSIELFDFIAQGKVKEALKLVDEVYYLGNNFQLILDDLLSVVNAILRIKYMQSEANVEQLFDVIAAKRLRQFANILSVSYLTILWQMLVKVISDVHITNDDYTCMQMAVVKCCHIWDKPMPIDIIENNNQSLLQTNSVTGNQLGVQISEINSFRDLVQLCYNKNELIYYHHLYEDINLVEFAPLKLKIKQNKNVPHNFVNNLSKSLKEWTGERWVVTVVANEGAPTLKTQDDEVKEQEMKQKADDELVNEVMNQFTGSKIVGIK